MQIFTLLYQFCVYKLLTSFRQDQVAGGRSFIGLNFPLLSYLKFVRIHVSACGYVSFFFLRNAVEYGSPELLLSSKLFPLIRQLVKRRIQRLTTCLQVMNIIRKIFNVRHINCVKFSYSWKRFVIQYVFGINIQI